MVLVIESLMMAMLISNSYNKCLYYHWEQFLEVTIDCKTELASRPTCHIVSELLFVYYIIICMYILLWFSTKYMMPMHNTATFIPVTRIHDYVLPQCL